MQQKIMNATFKKMQQKMLYWLKTVLEKTLNKNSVFKSLKKWICKFIRWWASMNRLIQIIDEFESSTYSSNQLIRLSDSLNFMSVQMKNEECNSFENLQQKCNLFCSKTCSEMKISEKCDTWRAVTVTKQDIYLCHVASSNDVSHDISHNH